ncbi:Uncharacterised protein [uncultured archaeon]|nr:Uncharacterised protein [uncultured archaeon]
MAQPSGHCKMYKRGGAKPTHRATPVMPHELPYWAPSITPGTRLFSAGRLRQAFGDEKYREAEAAHGQSKLLALVEIVSGMPKYSEMNPYEALADNYNEIIAGIEARKRKLGGTGRQKPK